MGFDELLAAIRGWAELTDEESTGVVDALADLTVYDDDQLTQVVEVAREVTADITAGDLGDEALAALEFLAVTVEAVGETLDAREADDAERSARAADLASRITGGDGDDGEPEGAADDGEDAVDDAEASAGEDPAPGAEDETVEPEAADERVPVAASADRPRIGRVSARRPQRSAPVVAPSGSAAPLVAAAGVPNRPMGARLDTADDRGAAFRDVLDTMKRGNMQAGMRVPVAFARAEYAEEGMLDQNARANLRKIESVRAPEAIAAAGGICAPPVPRYDLPSFGSASRPVRDSLANFGAERGGVILPSIPRLTDLDDAVGFWTVQDDEDAAGEDGPTKPCLVVECGDDETVVPYAVTQCLEIGNWNARTWPERIDEFLRLLEVQTARKAEVRLLQGIAAGSTAVTVPQNLGAARDILAALDLAVAGYESRHRIENASFTWLAPTWLRRMIRTDLTREMPGSADERLAAADAEIDAFLRVRGITPRWILDGEAGQIFGTQADGALVDWMATSVTYLYETGTWLGLNGGELNLGVVRDSGLNARNSYQIFSEFWEAPAFYGLESLRLSMTICPSGATAGTLEPVCDPDDRDAGGDGDGGG